MDKINPGFNIFNIHGSVHRNNILIQGVPLAAEPGISLIILTPTKILQ